MMRLRLLPPARPAVALTPDCLYALVPAAADPGTESPRAWTHPLANDQRGFPAWGGTGQAPPPPAEQRPHPPAPSPDSGRGGEVQPLPQNGARLRRPYHRGRGGDPGLRSGGAGEGAHEAPALEAQLQTAFVALRDELGGEAGGLQVALLPPLVQVRSVSLPPLREVEERRILARDAGKYFLGVREPHVVAAAPLPAAPGAPRRVLAAAAPTRWLEAIHAAAAAAGFTIESIVPAHIAWGAARALWPALSGGGDLVLLRGERIEVVRLGPAGVEEVIALPAAEEPERIAAALEEALGTARPLALCGPEPLRAALAERLTARGFTVAAAANPTPLLDSPELLAARFAGRSFTLALVPDAEHARRRRRTRRRVAAMLGASALLLLAAAGMELWGLQRELAAVRAEREAIRPQVEGVIEVRETLDQVGGRLATLGRLDASAPRWSGVVADVAEHLPRDAYLAAFRASADSLLIEGTARHATGVFAAMRETPGLVEVRPDRPVEQQLGDGRTPSDHFVLAARVAAPDSAEVPR